MESIDKYLQYLNERRSSVPDNTIMYHGSRIQDLKMIDPQYWVDALRKSHTETIWASWNKSFAAMFCIDWRKNIQDIWIGTNWTYVRSLPTDYPEHCWDDDALNKKYDKYDRCKKLEKQQHWKVTVPTRYSNLLKSPCSLYIIKGEDWVVPKKDVRYAWDWPEAYSKKPAKVIKEIKYNSVEEAYKKNNIELLIENNRMNTNDLQRFFARIQGYKSRN